MLAAASHSAFGSILSTLLSVHALPTDLRILKSRRLFIPSVPRLAASSVASAVIILVPSSQFAIHSRFFSAAGAIYTALRPARRLLPREPTEPTTSRQPSDRNTTLAPFDFFTGSIRFATDKMSDKAEESTSAEAQITFKVKASGDKNHQITMAEAATVGELKTKLATEQYENIPVERQRLIYSGRVMKNEDTLASYKVKPGNTIHLVKSAASNPAPAPSASSSSPVPQAVPSNMAAGTSANNLLAGLTGARFAGHANLPSANMFGADGGVRIMPSAFYPMSPGHPPLPAVSTLY